MYIYKTQSFFWNETLFLLACQINTCTYYQGADISNLDNRQIIEHINLLPIDACFFTRENQLFVIISYGLADYSTNKDVPSK
jgi:hypothetical protein